MIRTKRKKVRKIDWIERIGYPLMYVVLILFSIYSIAPFIWAFILTLKDYDEIMGSLVNIWPRHPDFENYYTLFTQSIYPRWLLNSIVASLGYTLISVVLCSIAAYSFAMFNFKGRNKLFLFMMGSVLVPFTSIAIPLFIEMANFKLVNNLWALILPGAANAFTIYYLILYIRSAVPRDLIDSARVDGCSELGILFRIVLPVILPGLAAMIIVNFVSAWNDFFWPLIILRTEDMYTVPVGLPTWNQFSGTTVQPVVNWQITGAVVSVIPILIIFAFGMSQFIKGITAGAVKE